MNEDNSISGPSANETQVQVQTETAQPSDAGAVASWQDGLPEDIKSSKSLSKFKDVENLARGYINAEQLLGRDKIPMPKTDSEFAELYTKLGCPTDVKEYSVSYDDSTFSDSHKAVMAEDLKAFLPMAKKAGLNNKQATTIFGTYSKLVSAKLSEHAAAVSAEKEAAEKALRKEFGETYDAKITLANRAMTAFADKELQTAIISSGLGRNPAFIKMMVKLGEGNAEEVGIDKSGSGSLMAPADIANKIAELQANPAYFDAKHPEHKIVVERVQSLFARKLGK